MLLLSHNQAENFQNFKINFIFGYKWTQGKIIDGIFRIAMKLTRLHELTGKFMDQLCELKLEVIEETGILKDYVEVPKETEMMASFL